MNSLAAFLKFDDRLRITNCAAKVYIRLGFCGGILQHEKEDIVLMREVVRKGMQKLILANIPWCDSTESLCSKDHVNMESLLSKTCFLSGELHSCLLRMPS